MTDARVVLVTTPDAEKGAEIGRALVEAGLCACANVVPGIRSIYAWQGKVEDESEALLVLKTWADRLEALEARLLALHPYEVPELLALPVEAGAARYLGWLRASTRGP